MTHRSHEGISLHQGKRRWHRLPCIGSYRYKPCMNLPFGDSAMYFDHVVKGKLNLISWVIDVFFSRKLVQTMLFLPTWRASKRREPGSLHFDITKSIKSWKMIQPVDQINNSLEDTIDGSELLRTICLSLIVKSQYNKNGGGKLWTAYWRHCLKMHVYAQEIPNFTMAQKVTSINTPTRSAKVIVYRLWYIIDGVIMC